jgi:hypothetical protein
MTPLINLNTLGHIVHLKDHPQVKEFFNLTFGVKVLPLIVHIIGTNLKRILKDMV